MREPSKPPASGVFPMTPTPAHIRHAHSTRTSSALAFCRRGDSRGIQATGSHFQHRLLRCSVVKAAERGNHRGGIRQTWMARLGGVSAPMCWGDRFFPSAAFRAFCPSVLCPDYISSYLCLSLDLILSSASSLPGSQLPLAAFYLCDSEHRALSNLPFTHPALPSLSLLQSLQNKCSNKKKKGSSNV